MTVQSWRGRFTRVCGNLGTPPFVILLGILLSRNTMFYFEQSQNPMKPVFDHHTITNKPYNIQIHPENRTKLAGHYTAPRRKITRVGGNLPLVAQFRVFCRLGLLTTQHSFHFLFLFPLFSSFLFFSFPPFLFPLFSPEGGIYPLLATPDTFHFPFSFNIVELNWISSHSQAHTIQHQTQCQISTMYTLSCNVVLPHTNAMQFVPLHLNP